MWHGPGSGTEARRGAELNAGEAFNPWRGACGFYPPDVVSALGRLSIVGTRRKLGDAHKRLYTLLVRRAGRDGLCFPGVEALAVDLGKSPRSVKMMVDDLEAFGLISHRRRGDGQRGEFTFLWHPIFVSGQRCKNGRSEVQESAFQTCKNEQPLYREEARTGETRTSKQAELPPPTITHPAGRVEPNPEYRRVVEVLRKAAPRIRAAKDPARYEQAIIMAEMSNRVNEPKPNSEPDVSVPALQAPDDALSPAADTQAAETVPTPAVEAPPRVPELSLDDRRLLAEARKKFRFASRENLLEAVAEMRAAKLRDPEGAAVEAVVVEKSDLEKRCDALRAENAKLRAEFEESTKMERFWADRALQGRPAAGAERPVGPIRMSMKGGGVYFPGGGFLDSLAG